MSEKAEILVNWLKGKTHSVELFFGSFFCLVNGERGREGRKTTKNFFCSYHTTNMFGKYKRSPLEVIDRVDPYVCTILDEESKVSKGTPFLLLSRFPLSTYLFPSLFKLKLTLSLRSDVMLMTMMVSLDISKK